MSLSRRNLLGMFGTLATAVAFAELNIDKIFAQNNELPQTLTFELEGQSVEFPFSEYYGMFDSWASTPAWFREKLESISNHRGPDDPSFDARGLLIRFNCYWKLCLKGLLLMQQGLGLNRFGIAAARDRMYLEFVLPVLMVKSEGEDYLNYNDFPNSSITSVYSNYMDSFGSNLAEGFRTPEDTVLMKRGAAKETAYSNIVFESEPRTELAALPEENIRDLLLMGSSYNSWQVRSLHFNHNLGAGGNAHHSHNPNNLINRRINFGYEAGEVTQLHELLHHNTDPWGLYVMSSQDVILATDILNIPMLSIFRMILLKQVFERLGRDANGFTCSEVAFATTFGLPQGDASQLSNVTEIMRVTNLALTNQLNESEDERLYREFLLQYAHLALGPHQQFLNLLPGEMFTVTPVIGDDIFFAQPNYSQLPENDGNNFTAYQNRIDVTEQMYRFIHLFMTGELTTATDSLDVGSAFVEVINGSRSLDSFNDLLQSMDEGAFETGLGSGFRDHPVISKTRVFHFAYRCNMIANIKLRDDVRSRRVDAKVYQEYQDHAFTHAGLGFTLGYELCVLGNLENESVLENALTTAARFINPDNLDEGFVTLLDAINNTKSYLTHGDRVTRSNIIYANHREIFGNEEAVAMDYQEYLKTRFDRVKDMIRILRDRLQR